MRRILVPLEIQSNAGSYFLISKFLNATIMGYMGFGMRKEVYTRKPKSSFSRIKKVYGDHLEEYYHFKNQTGKWSDKDKEDFKNFITKKIRQNRIEEDTYNILIYLAILFIIGLSFYFALIVLSD